MRFLNDQTISKAEGAVKERPKGKWILHTDDLCLADGKYEVIGSMHDEPPIKVEAEAENDG